MNSLHSFRIEFLFSSIRFCGFEITYQQPLFSHDRINVRIRQYIKLIYITLKRKKTILCFNFIKSRISRTKQRIIFLKSRVIFLKQRVIFGISRNKKGRSCSASPFECYRLFVLTLQSIFECLLRFR